MYCVFVIVFYLPGQFQSGLEIMGRLEFDEILKHIGQFGPWQIRIHFLMWLTSAAGGLAVVVYTFTAYGVDYRCINPYCENPESAIYNDSANLDNAGLSACEYQGFDKDILPPPQLQTEQYCQDYHRLLSQQSNNSIRVRCSHDDLVFDQGIVTSSLMQDYGFTCENAYLKSIYGSLYMLGMLLGSYTVGAISDKYGRIKALMLGIVLVSSSGFLGAFMPNAHGFGFFRFLTGIGGIACFMVTFVIVVETVGVKYTMLAGIFIEIPFALGELLLGLEAYFIRDWFTLQLVAYTPLIILLGLYFLVPESPRWLIATGRYEEAVKIIKAAAITNKRDVPDSLLEVSKLSFFSVQNTI